MVESLTVGSSMKSKDKKMINLPVVVSKRTGIDPMLLAYIERGNWICGKSPTGAHHWVYDEKGCYWRCIHCLIKRQFPATLRESLLEEVV